MAVSSVGKQMNFILFISSLVGLCVAVIHGLFLFKGKSEFKTALYCLKVCPLYCPQHRSKRDVDDGEIVTIDPIYFDPEEGPWQESPDEIDWSAAPYTPYHKPHLDWYEYWHKKTTTTTMAPKTTTEATYICYLCKKKCEDDKKWKK